MPLEITSLSELDTDAVQQIREQQQQLIAETYPEYQTRRGVISGVLLRVQAALEAAVRTYIDRILQSLSLLDITNNPELADPELVDRTLSNYRIPRLQGVAAEGQVTIVISTRSPVTVPSGSRFTGNGVAFQTVLPFAARLTQGTIISATDRLLQPLGDGTYAFTIDVQAVEVGVSGLLRLGTRIDPAQPPRGFLRAFAAKDFSGGRDTETNEELIARLDEGAATKAYSNRITTTAMILNEEEFASTIAVSMIGHADPEQLRHKHGIFPVAHGGRVDVYVRTSGVPLSLRVRKTCTLTSQTADGGVFQFTLGRDEVPGCYDVEAVIPVGTSDTLSGFTVLSEQRGIDLTGDTPVPDIVSAVEAAFTRYQTLTVRFVDPADAVVSMAVDDVKDYDIIVRYMPQIADLQAFLGHRDRCPPMADILVRAAIPCFTSINFDIRKRAVTTIDDTLVGQIRQAVAAAVNATGFLGQLHASALADVVQDLLPTGTWTSGFDMFGKVLRPDGTFSYIRDQAVLTVPAAPALMIGGRTVAFLVDPADIGIAVVNSGIPEV
jgi:hypothetical protein